MKLLLSTVLVGITAGWSPGQDEVPTPAAAKALVERLDVAFNLRDLEALLGCFEGENLQLMRVLAERMTPVLNGPVRLHRDSEIISYMPVSRRGVALVKSTTSVDPTNPPVLEEYSYLVMKRQGERAVATFTVEVDFDLLGNTAGNKFSCPACNYEVMGAPGWLAVPHRPERTQCMEAISFYYLGTDLTLDLSVFVDPEPLQAMGAMRQYLAFLFEQAGTSGDVDVRTWTPPAYGGNPPAALDGASAELALPGLQLARHYLATLGSLRYLLVLNGNAGALVSHSREADAILNSFRILDPTIPASELKAMPIRAHTGGSTLDGAKFTNPTYRVTLEGPDGWTPSVNAAGYLFEVAYRCPLGRGTLWATAYRPQAGLTAWYTGIADSWVENHCRERGLEIQEDSGWSEPGGDFRFRNLETSPPRNSTGAEALPRMIRLAMSDDLLLVLHGYGQDQSDRGLVTASFDTLRRTRYEPPRRPRPRRPDPGAPASTSCS